MLKFTDLFLINAADMSTKVKSFLSLKSQDP